MRQQNKKVRPSTRAIAVIMIVTVAVATMAHVVATASRTATIGTDTTVSTVNLTAVITPVTTPDISAEGFVGSTLSALVQAPIS